MGYFRIFYYIAYTFNTVCRILKKFGKKILWFVGIFVFLCFCLYGHPVHAAQNQATYTTDTTYLILQNYDRYLDNLTFIFDNYYGLDSTTTTYFDQLFADLKGNYFVYFYSPGSTGEVNHSVFGLVYTNGGIDTNVVNTNVYFNDYLQVPSTGYNVSANKIFNMAMSPRQVFSYQEYSSTFTTFVPSCLLRATPTKLYNLMVRAGYTYERNDLIDIEQILTEIENEVSDIQNVITAEPDEDNFSADELPQDSGVTATTDEGLNNIFTQIYNRLTANPSSLGSMYNIEITIPFTNKSFVIPYNLTSSVLAQSSFSWLRSFINAFWCYLVGRYIIIDLIDKFEKIQTGNIENLENGNIKEDLL